jgi:hypothetical protein
MGSGTSEQTSNLTPFRINGTTTFSRIAPPGLEIVKTETVGRRDTGRVPTPRQRGEMLWRLRAGREVAGQEHGRGGLEPPTADDQSVDENAIFQQERAVKAG